MSVYVDNAQIRFGRMKMSHMVADSLDELHSMAHALGVRRWFQADASFPHYDVCAAKREEALRLGARPIGRRELVELMRRARRGAGPAV